MQSWRAELPRTGQKAVAQLLQLEKFELHVSADNQTRHFLLNRNFQLNRALELNLQTTTNRLTYKTRAIGGEPIGVQENAPVGMWLSKSGPCMSGSWIRIRPAWAPA